MTILLKGQVHDRSANFLKNESKPQKPKTRQRIKPVSTKRMEANKIYEKIKRQWKKEREAIDLFRCQFVAENGSRCRRRASDSPHHTKRRGKYLLCPETFMAVCQAHHRFIEENGKWSVSKGYLIREYDSRRDSHI